jgi:hypothetical protein
MSSQTLTNLASTLSKNEKANLQILNYIKETTTQRLTQGKSNIIIQTNLPPYVDMLRESKRILQTYSTSKKNKLAEKYNMSNEDVDNIIDEMVSSINNSIQKEMTSKPQDPDMEYYGSGISQNKKTKDIYITGKKVEERELVKPKYKQVNSKPKTLVKQEINEDLVHNVQRWKLKLTELTKLKVVYS